MRTKSGGLMKTTDFFFYFFISLSQILFMNFDLLYYTMFTFFVSHKGNPRLRQYLIRSLFTTIISLGSNCSVDHYRKYPVNDAMHKNGNNGPAVDTKWFYLGPDKEKYGPYLSKDMNFWLQAGYFTNELQLKTENEQNYHTLGEWTQILGTPPFLNPVHSLEAVAAAAQWQQQVRAAPAPMMVMPPGLQNQFPPQMRLQYPPFVPMPFLHQMNQNGPPMHSQPPSEPIDAGSLSHTPDSENDLQGHGAKPHQSQFHQMHQLTKQMHHVNIATEPIVMKNAECQTDPVKVEISKTNASRLLSELLGQIVVIN
ncbi:hypothetical protein CRE_05454 [Caenorhabditis remanei]|uniref:GYF domain-containing protein n=1 Tax=Caenorhabditis remanei TaxID=31234 RepID=E3M0L5_CAERE|nr:hypothetical protein CRE_05454 [Caenorhabditis remanei]